MAKTYNEMIALVISWSNKDPDVFSIEGSPTEYTRTNAGRVPDFLQYAADKAYRTLRVPSLEFSRIFDVADSDLQVDPVNTSGTTINMPVPNDLIEVMHIRNVTQGFVYNEKIDMRTFFDRYAEKDSVNFWTRQGNVFKISGRTTPGDEIEIHYYRRLPAMDATYNVSAATYNIYPEGFKVASGAVGANTGTLFFPVGTTFDGVTPTYNPNTLIDAARKAANIMGDRTFELQDDGSYLDVTGESGRTPLDTDVVIAFSVSLELDGVEIEHWLRDENERVVLFGALAEAFAYLEEDTSQQKYMQMFQMETEELNKEEKMRMHKGGNVKRSFNGRGLI